MDHGQPPEDRARVERGTKTMGIAEPHHRNWRRKANHYMALWNNYQDHTTALRDASSPRGRDDVRRSAQSVFGSELFVPMAFGIVEAIVPQMIANRPKMLALARDEDSERNVENVQYVIDAQQQKMDYEMRLQTIAKDGLIVGLGCQKVQWKAEHRRRKRNVPSEAGRTVNESGWAVATTLEPVYDDPDAEAIDPFDLFWDPAATNVATADFIVHRSWRSMDYIAKKAMLAQQGDPNGWRNLDNLGKIEGLGSSVRYDETWAERMRALGYTNLTRRGDDRLHEVLEFHYGGEEVETILDREICVGSMENPHWHAEKPFQVFTPTEITHRFFGKGEIEPIEDLQKEINELRRGRRDNAMFVLQKVFAFNEGLVEVDNFKFGPGVGIPVQGDPRELLFPINVGDIPYAGYQEEQALKDDFQFASGISDPTQDNPSQETATGAQLVYQATSRRVANKTRRLELQIIAPGTSQMHMLNQQRILAERSVRVDAAPVPGEPERRYRWKQIGPAELAGEFTWQPAGGATMPENVPQMRADAEMKWTMFSGNHLVDQTVLVKDVLTDVGIKHPEAWVVPEDHVPPETLDLLLQAGVPREMLVAALEAAKAGEEMEAEGETPQEPAPMNGNAPPAEEPANA